MSMVLRWGGQYYRNQHDLSSSERCLQCEAIIRDAELAVGASLDEYARSSLPDSGRGCHQLSSTGCGAEVMQPLPDTSANCDVRKVMPRSTAGSGHHTRWGFVPLSPCHQIRRHKASLLAPVPSADQIL